MRRVLTQPLLRPHVPTLTQDLKNSRRSSIRVFLTEPPARRMPARYVYQAFNMAAAYTLRQIGSDDLQSKSHAVFDPLSPRVVGPLSSRSILTSSALSLCKFTYSVVCNTIRINTSLLPSRLTSYSLHIHSANKNQYSKQQTTSTTPKHHNNALHQRLHLRHRARRHRRPDGRSRIPVEP